MIKVEPALLLLINFINPEPLSTSGEATWPTGYWTQVEDEDGQASDDTFQVLADGSVLTYDKQCRVIASGLSHIHDGILFVTWESKKGPIAIAYVPSQNRKRLTFTSPRTGNNAVYSRSQNCYPAQTSAQ